jgi:hypothetical protein
MMTRNGKIFAGAPAKTAFTALLAALFVIVLSASIPALAGGAPGPVIPVPTPTYDPGSGSPCTGSCGPGNHNANGDQYFGDGYTSLDDTTQIIWLDWVIYLHWLPPHMNMAQQLTANMAYQVLLVGSLLDAKNQQETQRLMQQMAAEAHRDYQPDMNMCEFGTNVRSLAAAEALARENARYLDLTLLKRDKLSGNLSNASGVDDDLHNRFDMFKRTYCDVNDDNGYMQNVCVAGVKAARINNDIDYTKTIENRYTLTADFSTIPAASAVSDDQQDVIALLRNIFSFRTFGHVSDTFLQQEFAKNTYLDMRSADAIRSVAHNSFAHIIGMRTAGTPVANSSQKFMRRVLDQLGAPVAEIDQFLGPQPSYYAQMEVLTHKIYEDPRFFTNLYTTPANVERIGVTLQALTLMQNRDRFEASLRREMLLSMILELQIRERQGHVLSDVQGSSNSLIGNPE